MDFRTTKLFDENNMLNIFNIHLWKQNVWSLNLWNFLV